jgi:hypothetical protein
MAARKCWNIKSRNHPDVPCTRSVFNDAEYCSLHYKNPRPFSKPCDMNLLRPKQKARLRRFVGLCKIVQGLAQVRRQGYAVTDPSLANNPTELISMESTDTIPIYFRFSILEDNRLWLFDIRSLVAEQRRVADSKVSFKNPYTSIQFTVSCLDRLEDCLSWLETRSYPCRTETVITHESYEQKLVELCYLIDSYGYLTNIYWFTHMHTVNVNQFIEVMNDMWCETLGLTDTQRLEIVPTWTPARGGLLDPLTTSNRDKALDTLSTTLLVLLKASPVRESRGLMAVYIVTALANICPGAARAFPWLL